MAKTARKGPSASQAIRDYCRENPDKSPKEVAAEMVARGFKTVTAGYVSTIKSLAKKAASEGESGETNTAGATGGAPASKSATGGAKRGRKPRVPVEGSRPGPKPGNKAKSSAAAGERQFTLDDLIKAKKLSEALGGVAQALKALEALAKLGN
ncbi:MAG: hypothetical protein RLY70_1044 [Planctomycetota bacterium]|jgi:hypothetical protein